MYKVHIRQVYSTRGDIKEPNTDWANRKVKIWRSQKLDFLPQIGALVNAAICNGRVTDIRHSVTSLDTTTHTIDLEENCDCPLSERDIKMLLGNQDTDTGSFTGLYAVEIIE